MPLIFDDVECRAAAKLIDLALAEDLQDTGDLTCLALIPETAQAEVLVVARQNGILAGGPIGELVFAALDPQVRWEAVLDDGEAIQPGTCVAKVSGSLRSLLTGERTALNFLTHLSGIATLTGQFVEAVKPANVQILDTRKTHPGWRVLEKYAVRAGGGSNHRMGLYDGCLIKDNHLAAWATGLDSANHSQHNSAGIAEAVRCAKQHVASGISVEVEVDTLDQLRDALKGDPDIVLLDNMTLDELREAVAIRNEEQPQVLLEASGGITLETVREIAFTGVERISLGALTHSAIACDLAFDWSQVLQ